MPLEASRPAKLAYMPSIDNFRQRAPGNVSLNYLLGP